MVKSTTLSCDWYENLIMYQLPQQYASEIIAEFSNISLVPVNCPGLPEYDVSSKIYFGNRIKEENLSFMQELEWVHFGSIGTDKLSPIAIKEKKLTITNSRNTMEEAVVASALAFIFSLARGQKKVHFSLQGETFGRKDYDEFFPFSSDVFGSSFCVLGYGPISRLLVKALKPLASEIKVVTRTNRNVSGIEFFNYTEIIEATKKADFIVNLLPQHNSTLNIVDNNVISNFKTDSYYINLGRHTTNDEESLVKAIYDRRLAGLGLDVFSGDTKLRDRMFKHYNVCLTPHVAAVSKNYWKKQIEILKWNLARYFEDNFKDMKNLVYLKGEPT